jgi:hypothetical protein
LSVGRSASVAQFHRRLGCDLEEGEGVGVVRHHPLGEQGDADMGGDVFDHVRG